VSALASLGSSLCVAGAPSFGSHGFVWVTRRRGMEFVVRPGGAKTPQLTPH
jgi:hypothetical protein